MSLFDPPPRLTNRSSTNNLLLSVAEISMQVCRRQLRNYSCDKSKHTYTQPQLMSCLVLKAYLKQTYRGIIDVLQVSDSLRQALGLEMVPAHATLKMFADRVACPELIDQIIGQVLALCRENGIQVHEVAADSTGIECSPASPQFLLRCGRKRGRYVKLSLAVACVSMLAVAAVASMGPSHDQQEVMTLLWRSSGRCSPDAGFFDSGYDQEKVHRFCRDGWGARERGRGCASFIPPFARGGHGVIKTRYRAQMAESGMPQQYGRRWHVESFISGLKRTTLSHVRARLEPAMLREALLNVLAYAIRR
jgi:hypothetical protein